MQIFKGKLLISSTLIYLLTTILSSPAKSVEFDCTSSVHRDQDYCQGDNKYQGQEKIDTKTGLEGLLVQSATPVANY